MSLAGLIIIISTIAPHASSNILRKFYDVETAIKKLEPGHGIDLK